MHACIANKILRTGESVPGSPFRASPRTIIGSSYGLAGFRDWSLQDSGVAVLGTLWEPEALGRKPSEPQNLRPKP